MAADSYVYVGEKQDQTFVGSTGEDKTGRFALSRAATSIEQVLKEVESSRETCWQRNPEELVASLRCRAFLVGRSLPILPGRTVLELAAGSGVWTEHLDSVLAGQNPITALVFNEDLAREGRSRKLLQNVRFVHVKDFHRSLFRESFDYIVGTDIMVGNLCAPTLEMIFQCLKPGGQFVLFGRNPSNPVAFLRMILRSVTGRGGRHELQQEILVQRWSSAAIHQGFGNIEVTPCEVMCPLESSTGKAVSLILERAPGVRCFSKVVSFQATKPAGVRREDVPHVNLATHRQLFGAVSFVVPCHNEEANIVRLAKTLLGMYGDYIYEIVIVDDNSTDGTAKVTAALASEEPRVKFIKRNPPGGVGRALRDGYAAAGGRYILTIDCDFVTIASEFKALFDAVAEGYDGAIGSRFSSESALVRYPFFKILCNRGYHLILNLLLGRRVRDISNNLKLYRADILKNLDIEEDRFAANVETGLKPLLMNYRIREVPTSWINRTPDMGKSSFSLLKVGPDYLNVLLRATWRSWRGRYRSDTAVQANPNSPHAE